MNTQKRKFVTQKGFIDLILLLSLFAIIMGGLSYCNMQQEADSNRAKQQEEQQQNK